MLGFTIPVSMSCTSRKVAALAGFFFLFIAATQSAGHYHVNPKCCSFNVMDSVGFVIVELKSNLPRDTTFRAIRTRFCTNTSVHLQVWTNKTDSNGHYLQLKWEQILTPNITTLSSDVAPVLIFQNPISLGADDYVALYSPAATSITVPFDFHSEEYAFKLSENRFPLDHMFSSNDRLDLSDLTWPRSFTPYLSFCTDIVCSEMSHANSGPPKMIFGPPGPTGPVGPPGPQGPPGPPCTGFDGGIFGNGGENFQCDVPDVTAAVVKAGQQVDTLENKVNIMLETLSSISEGKVLTGICPGTTRSGPFGLGSCYVFSWHRLPMGAAEVFCRDEYQGHLVKIDSRREEEYIKEQAILLRGNFSNPAADFDRFWTSALWSRGERAWVWYDEPKIRQAMTYQNWRTGRPLAPVDTLKICMATEVIYKDGVSSWIPDRCMEKHLFICEIPKTCL